MDKLLETYNLPRLNHEEIENLNRSITNRETESVIKYHPTKKSSGPHIFIGEFYQIFIEKLMSSLLKFSQKN